MCPGVIERLDVIENQDRRRARASGDIAAEHEYHAELTQSMGECQHRSGDEAAARERYGDGEKAIPGRRAQRSCDLECTRTDGLKRALQWLDDERHGIEHRTEHQTGEAEAQRLHS